MGQRVKKGKVMNKIRPVNRRNAAKRQQRVSENAKVLKSLSSASTEKT
jgi:hypothetical protein